MRLERNTDPTSDQENVSETIAATIAQFRDQCTAQAVTIDMDLDDCQAIASTSFVNTTTAGMILNALHAMPAGGELTITLIESPHQWELEVADSGPNPSQLGKGKPDESPVSGEAPTDLPRVIEFPATEELRGVIRIAGQHGSSVESFACPLGGTAWVMAVPKLRTDLNTGARAA